MKWVCLLAFGSVGIAAFGAGLVWGAKRWQLQKNGVRVKGVVVDNEVTRTETRSGSTTRNSSSIYPLVEFVPADGRKRQFRGSTGSSSADYSVGQAVDVIYDREDPDRAQIADFTQFWLGPVVIALFGFFFLSGGVGGFYAIADSDRTFGPAFHARMNRGRLYDAKQGVRVKGVVKGVEKEDDGYTLLVEASVPGGAPREFIAVLALDPGPVQGKSVEVYLDPQDPDAYYVHADPLLQRED